MKLRASLPGSVISVSDPLCILTVHAHPDDESSKGAGTIARYHAEGVHTVLVCCTGGEEGEILNPALNTPEVKARIADLRTEELKLAADIIGYDEVVMLGYRDSGMAGAESNANPASFAQAPFDEAVGRLVSVVRRTRPQVMVVYGDDQSGYPHPDHLKVHDIGVAAFGAAGDPERYREAGDPWQPEKLYYTEFSVARFKEVHQKFVDLGLQSPFDEEWRKRWEGVPVAPVTTSIDIAGPRHPGRPHVSVLVRPSSRRHADDPPLRRLPTGVGGGSRRHRRVEAEGRHGRRGRNRPVRRHPHPGLSSWAEPTIGPR
jgi:mycothiol S-conjugate amidase